MKKTLITIFISVVVAGVSYFIYKASTFNVFDVEIRKIAEIEIPTKYKIGVFYLPSNASSQSYIQIRRSENGEVLKNYERYNFVNDYKLFNDTLSLVLSDTSFVKRKADTLFFKIP
jgi:hypothetical protein